MKKILASLAAVMLLGIQPVGAQAFLNRIKEKAGAAIGNALSEKMGNKVEEKVTEKSGVNVNALAGTEERQLQSSAPSVITPEQQLQRRRTSSFGWDVKVTPSDAKFPIPLLNEFPAVPSAQELANPTEAGMISYYNAIKKVTLRAEELNSDTTCEDNFSVEWRKKQENKIREAFGLTEAEWNLLNSENATDAQREAIENKIQMAMFGGVDMKKAAEDAQANMKRYENMSEADREAEMMRKSTKAVIDVYKEDPAETKYVTGLTPAELEKGLTEEMEFQAKAMKSNSNYSGATSPFSKKMQEYEKTMTARDGAAYKKRADAMNKKVQDASMKAMRDMEGVGSLMAGLNNMRSVEDKIGMKDIQAAERSYFEASMPMMNAIEAGSDIDAKFSAAERKKVQAIKDQIYSTDDPDKYNPLYLQALESIKSYRVRAAGLWSAVVQKRFNDVKALMPDYIKAQRKAVEDGIIPECGLWRAPLNVVIEAGDILEEAYSEFPCDYPHMYLEELKDELRLKENEELWWPENYALLGNINDILMRKFLFKAVHEDGDYKIYQWAGADWKPVPEDFDEEKLQKVEEPQSAVWKSRDGKREVIYNADGHWIQLPEGDMIYPIALDKQDDTITWVVLKENYLNITEETTYTKILQIYKCTYKL